MSANSVFMFLISSLSDESSAMICSRISFPFSLISGETAFEVVFSIVSVL